MWSIDTDKRLFIEGLHTARCKASETGRLAVSKVWSIAAPSLPAWVRLLSAVRMRMLLSVEVVYTFLSGMRCMVHPLSMAVDDHFQPMHAWAGPAAS